MADILTTGSYEAGDGTLLVFQEEVRILLWRGIISAKRFLQDEGLAMFLYEKFFRHGPPQPEISETAALQAFDEYFTNLLSNEVSSGAEDHPEPSQPPDDPVENVPDDMQRCHWMNEATHQKCPALVSKGLKSMLSHLNRAHGVSGSEKIQKECKWAVLRSGSESACGTTFQRRNIPRHVAKHLGLRWLCKLCGKSFARSDLLKPHVRKDHER
ncbi:hypothetical protein DEU56DRAFT_483192 [Suillus clintonianus]|uniref:uncharacterized protein n=1 Tax=Suillus clintonianus TaxID=1904413 RepID=UPI001B8849FE|nr:uncharacterized protein DEU56DRAFT_483192 [Suillus clintonianus]KAG2153386.1 hypothetical protein DEU56DRAFT_483192 [Suillus clintonianus]